MSSSLVDGVLDLLSDNADVRINRNKDLPLRTIASGGLHINSEGVISESFLRFHCRQRF